VCIDNGKTVCAPHIHESLDTERGIVVDISYFPRHSINEPCASLESAPANLPT
jgi:hypothetical protein